MVASLFSRVPHLTPTLSAEPRPHHVAPPLAQGAAPRPAHLRIHGTRARQRCTQHPRQDVSNSLNPACPLGLRCTSAPWLLLSNGIPVRQVGRNSIRRRVSLYCPETRPGGTGACKKEQHPSTKVIESRPPSRRIHRLHPKHCFAARAAGEQPSIPAHLPRVTRCMQDVVLPSTCALVPFPVLLPAPDQVSGWQWRDTIVSLADNQSRSLWQKVPSGPVVRVKLGEIRANSLGMDQRHHRRSMHAL